jgi:hypothetical protein
VTGTYLRTTDFPVVPAHEPRTEAQRRADTSGRPQRWRKRVVYPVNRPGLTSL